MADETDIKKDDNVVDDNDSNQDQKLANNNDFMKVLDSINESMKSLNTSFDGLRDEIRAKKVDEATPDKTDVEKDDQKVDDDVKKDEEEDKKDDEELEEIRKGLGIR